MRPTFVYGSRKTSRLHHCSTLPSGAGRSVQNGAVLWECRGRPSHRGAQVHGLAMGAGCGGAGRATRRHHARPESRDSHASTFLCPSSSDARSPDKLSLPLAGALVDTDDADIPGAGAGSDEESGNGAVEYCQRLSKRMLDQTFEHTSPKKRSVKV